MSRPDYLDPQFEATLEEICVREIEEATKEYPVKATDILREYWNETRESLCVRRVQETIQRLRLQGLPILASARGYYWPENEEELYEYNKVLAGRVKELSVVLAALKKAYPRINVQARATIEAV